MKPLTIGRGAGAGVEAIGFYERRGLIQSPPRKESGYRQYQEDVIARLRFIKKAKELGFSLKEIGELLSLRLDPSKNCSHVKKQTEARLDDVEARIKSLQRIKRVLTRLTAACNGKGRISECPILEALETSERV